MKIINLVKSEFIKNYTITKFIIISLVLLISSIIIVEQTNISYQPQIATGFSTENISSYDYDELSNKEKRTFEEDYILYQLKVEREISEYVKKGKFDVEDWKNDILREIRSLLAENYAIDLLINNRDNSEIVYACNNKKDTYIANFNNKIYNLCESNNDELRELKEKNQKTIDEYTELIKENKYYLYLKYLKGTDYYNVKNEEMLDFIIDKEIMNEDNYLAKNYIEYSGIGSECISEDEFIEYEFAISNDWSNYNHYLKYCKIENKIQESDDNIIKYSTLNEIPHDLRSRGLHGSYSHEYYFTSKIAVNQVFHLVIVVLVLVSITSGGIVSKEHNKGTIKNIITTPVKRSKVILSKFIYLILHTYIIWLIGLFIISIYSGFKFGFKDLITPKLIYTNGKVIEVNYYLNLLKDMFIASIPIISFLSVMLFLSTITLNTALTTSITSILGISSPILYFICSNMKVKFFVYTPFLYLDPGFIINRNEWYEMILRYVDANISFSIGIITSIITSVVLYLITNIVYIKRDIKN